MLNKREKKQFVIRNDVTFMMQEEEIFDNPEAAYKEAIQRFPYFTICELVAHATYREEVTRKHVRVPE